MIFTSSWDDGHPLDERLADMLGQHGFAATFFVPIRNREGLPVMTGAALRRLAMTHEIGSHTFDHVYLRNEPEEVMRYQIHRGKAELEDALGRAVCGFCYPGGKFNSTATAIVREAGFAYARSTEDLSVGVTEEPFRMPTTLQFFPHRRAVFARHFVKYSRRIQKTGLLLKLMACRSFAGQLDVVTRHAHDKDAILHIWGHSWELERHGLWTSLERFLKGVAELRPTSLPLRNLVGLYRQRRS
jgi:peptidoglycan/xylan/chitin deacetylase (PgdA/CDA1 family)